MVQEGLRVVAHRDMGRIIDDDAGFKWLCTVTDPSGVVYPDIPCRSNDVHLVVDPGTQQVFIGRQVTIVFYKDDLIALGIGGIEGVIDEDKKPWVIDVLDIHGVNCTLKVVAKHPDASLGPLVLETETIE